MQSGSGNFWRAVVVDYSPTWTPAQCKKVDSIVVSEHRVVEKVVQKQARLNVIGSSLEIMFGSDRRVPSCLGSDKMVRLQTCR